MLIVLLSFIVLANVKFSLAFMKFRAYAVYGQEYIWQKRQAVAIQWHKLRERFS